MIFVCVPVSPVNLGPIHHGVVIHILAPQPAPWTSHYTNILILFSLPEILIAVSAPGSNYSIMIGPDWSADRSAALRESCLVRCKFYSTATGPIHGRHIRARQQLYHVLRVSHSTSSQGCVCSFILVVL